MTRYESYVDVLEKRKPIFLGLTALLVITSLIGIFRVNIVTDFSVFMPTDSDQIHWIERSAELFGDSDQLIVLVQSDESAEDLRTSASLAEEMAALEGVGRADAPLPQSLLDLPDDQLSRTLEQINETTPLPLVSPRDEGGVWLTYRVYLDGQTGLSTTITGLEDMLITSERDYIMSGEPYLEGKIFGYILQVLIFLPPAAIILLLLVFRLRIGSMRATILSMIPAVLGAVLTLGTLSWVQGTITMMSAIVPIFIIVLGSADGLHVTSHVIDRLREGKSNREAVAGTLQAVGVPIIMTSVTTMAGFLSMLLIDSPAIREMGIGAALGILLAGAATWIVLPVILLHQKPLASHKAEEKPAGGFLHNLQGWPALTITAVLVLASIPGALDITSDFSMLSMYKKNTEVRQSIDRTADILGGAIPVTLVYPAETLMDEGAKEAVMEFSERAAELGIAEKSVSVYSAVNAMLSANPQLQSMAANPVMREMLLSNMTEANPELTSSFFSEGGYGRAMFILPDLDNETLGQFTLLAADVSRQYGIELQPVGNAFAMKEMNDTIIGQQINSLLLAVALVIVLTSITQRSIKLGLLSGFPIAVTLLVLFGFMGYSGIELSVVSGIMTGLTVGVGIDYAIHYVSLYRFFRRNEATSDEKQRPATTALTYVATPILANAMGLAIGFTAMSLSPFRIHVTLSLLMWVTMIVSGFLSLSLLPTLLGIKKEQQGNMRT